MFILIWVNFILSIFYYVENFVECICLHLIANCLLPLLVVSILFCNWAYPIKLFLIFYLTTYVCVYIHLKFLLSFDIETYFSLEDFYNIFSTIFLMNWRVSYSLYTVYIEKKFPNLLYICLFSCHYFFSTPLICIKLTFFSLPIQGFPQKNMTIQGVWQSFTTQYFKECLRKCQD